MKRSQKDEILQIAFGDTNDSARIEQLRETSHEAIREIESLRNIKLNLQQLPVPECQLSTERLRDAILNTGLGEKTTSSQPMWKLAWVPVAVLAVTFFGSQMIRSSRLTEPTLMGASIVKEEGPDVAIDFNPTIQDVFPDFPDTEPIIIENPTSAPAIKHSNRKPNYASRSGSSRTVLLVKSEPAAKSALTAMETVAVSTPSALGGGGLPIEAMAPSGVSSDSGIVLIGSDRDSMTGANKAIEVTDTSSMVTGG